MVMYRCFWLCAGVCGYVQVFVVMYRCLWLCTGVSGCVQVFLAVYRCLWLCTGVSGCVQVLQFDIAHSGPTALIMWAWRLFEGQALLQFVLVATFIDRVLVSWLP